MASDDDIPGFPSDLLPDNISHFPDELMPFLKTLETWTGETWREQEPPPTSGGATAMLAYYERLIAGLPSRLEHAEGAAIPTRLQIQFRDGSRATVQLVAPGDVSVIWPPRLGLMAQARQFFEAIENLSAWGQGGKVMYQKPLWTLVREEVGVDADRGDPIEAVVDGDEGRDHQPPLGGQVEGRVVAIEEEALENLPMPAAEFPTRH